MLNRRCAWCGDPAADFTLCDRCTQVAEPYVTAASLSEFLFNPPDPLSTELHEAAGQLALRLARGSQGSWEERVNRVQEELAIELSKVLLSSGMCREFVQIACASRKEAIQALGFAGRLDAWSGEGRIVSNDLVHLAAGSLPSALPPRVPDPSSIVPIYRADALANAWRTVTVNAAVANAVAITHAVSRPEPSELIGVYEPAALTDYYTQIEHVADAQKPEDYEVSDSGLRRSLENRGVLPRQIVADVDQDLAQTCGFGVADLHALADAVRERFREFGRTPLLPQFVEIAGTPCQYGLGVERKDRLRETYLRHGGDAANWLSMVRAFSAPRVGSKRLELEATDRFRHAFLYEAGDYYMVALLSLANAVDVFRQSVLTGHFLGRFGGDPDFRSKALGKAGNRMATFLSFVVAEWFASAGFKVPTEGGVPRGEIKKIRTKGKTLRITGPSGNDLGDLDVLAVDEGTRTVRIIEIKYWKPGPCTVTSIAAGSKLDSQLREKIMARHRWVETNLRAVVEFAGAAAGSYTVTTTLAASRPMLQDDPVLDVTYLAALKEELDNLR